MFQLVRTSPSVAGLGVRAMKLINSLKIPLSRKVSVERKFDTKLDLLGLRGEQRKYYSSRSKAPKLFQLVWTSPLVAELGVRAETLSKFLENLTFVDGFGGKAVRHEIGSFRITG